MGRDDHQRASVLALLEFAGEPGEPGLVETAQGAIRLAGSLADTVEDDDR